MRRNFFGFVCSHERKKFVVDFVFESKNTAKSIHPHTNTDISQSKKKTSKEQIDDQGEEKKRVL